jgi:hypothetical protein
MSTSLRTLRLQDDPGLDLYAAGVPARELYVHFVLSSSRLQSEVNMPTPSKVDGTTWHCRQQSLADT